MSRGIATIDDYRTRRGEPRFGVQWQHRTADGIVRQSMTFAERVDAERFIQMLDAFGGDGEKDLAAVGGPDMAIKTVWEVILAYIEANHRAAPAQLCKYATRSGIHVDDPLGHTPIACVDADAIQGWVARLRAKQVGRANSHPRKTRVCIPVRAGRSPEVDPTTTCH